MRPPIGQLNWMPPPYRPKCKLPSDLTDILYQGIERLLHGTHLVQRWGSWAKCLWRWWPISQR